MIPLPLQSECPLPPVPVRAGALVDTFGRRHNNLRISVTDRCNLRCLYCMPEDVTFLPREHLLSFEEITEFVRLAVPLGIDKVRLTGGEPLMRRELPRLVEMLAGIPGLRDLGLTTNGLLLADQAHDLHAAGLTRLNVSLDTLDAERFVALARRPGLERVVAGIAAAQAAGFVSIKVNAVIMRGSNDADIVPLARFARAEGLELRFIEYMPIGAEAWERAKLFPAAEILDRLGREVCPLVPVPDGDPRAPAVDYAYTDGRGVVGMIASVSRPFCGTCNRVRLTADGKLRNCLFALTETDVKAMLRQTPTDAAGIAAALRASIWAKWAGHEINTAAFVKPDRTMHAIGG